MCFVLEASPRLELGVRILQTLALPLGYDADLLLLMERGSLVERGSWMTS